MTDPTGYFPVPTQIQGQGLMPPNMQTQPFNPLMSTGYAPGQYTQAAQGLASGLLGPMNQNTQQAYQLAGSPSMGPFASLTPPPLKPGSTGGSITNNTTGGGALGLGGLLSDASTASKLYSAVSGLLGPSLAQYGSGAIGNAALQQAVNSLGGTPALTNAQLGLTPGGGVPGGDSGGAAAGGDAAAAAAGVGGLLAAAAPAAAPAGAVTITDLAGNILAGGAPAAADAGVAAAGADAGATAGTTAASGASAGSGAVAAANVALPAFLGYELASGLVNSSSDPEAAAQRAAWTNPSNINASLEGWLGTSGTPALKGVSGDGSSQYPITYTLADGTQLNGSQWTQLSSLYQQAMSPYAGGASSVSDIQKFLSSLPKTSTATAAPTAAQLQQAQQNAAAQAAAQQAAQNAGSQNYYAGLMGR